MADQKQETAVAAPVQDKTLRGLLQGQQFLNTVKQALPRHMSAERFIRVAVTALTRTPKLQKCTQSSFFRCLIDLSAMGLEPDGRRAHLIPFENKKLCACGHFFNKHAGQKCTQCACQNPQIAVECTLIVDYKGIVQLVRQSGEVANIHCDVVYEGDKFDYQYGTDAFLEHKPNLDDPERLKKRKRYAYSFVKLKDGSEDFMVWGMSQVMAIKARSNAADSGPWVTDEDEMSKKSVFRNHSKWLPISYELAEKIEKDDDATIVDANFQIEEAPDDDEPGSVERAEAVRDEKIKDLKHAGAIIKEVRPQGTADQVTDADVPAHVKDILVLRQHLDAETYDAILKKHKFAKAEDVPEDKYMAIMADMNDAIPPKSEAGKADLRQPKGQEPLQFGKRRQHEPE